jgi:hypothetical protein
LPDDTSAFEAWSLTDGEIRELTRAVFRARAGLEELAVRLAAVADDCGLARQDGCASTSAWLAQVAGLSKYEAAKLVSLSRTMSPEVEATRWILTVPRRSSAKRLESQEQRAFEGTQLTMVDNGEGVTHLKGQIPTAQAGMLRTALEAFASPRRQNVVDLDRGPHAHAALGHPNHAQRMGWAFLELIEHLPSDKLAQAGGLPAVVTIETTLDALRTELGKAGLTCGTEISASQARRMACNANLIPIVMDGDSKILDIAPTRPLHDRSQRHVIAKRDGGCCWKGCDKPPAWCEVHHPEPYAQSGPTTVDNGALFCFLHHHLLHDADWHARMAPDGIIEVIPPARIDPHRRPLRHARFTKLQPRAA